MIPRTRLLHISGLILGVLVWLANAGNPPNGMTGAPFDSTCNSCHGGGNYGGNVTVDGLPGTIAPNTTYPLNVTLSPTSGNPNRGGFQLVVVDDNNVNSGNLTNSNGQSGTEFSGGREYLDHRVTKLFGGGPISWSFTWTSPASAAGNMVNFYFIGNFCNGTGSTDGDSPINDFLAIPFGGGGPPVTCQITGSTNVTCFGGNNGSATVTATGGTPPLTYTWSNGQTQPTAVNLSAGTYTVTVAGGSSATASVVITQPPALNASTSVSGQITCNTPAVNVTATVSGGTGPYNYAWSNGDNFNPASYTSVGPGSVTVTDNNGCTRTANFTVNGNTTPPNASAAAPGAFTCANPSMVLSGAGSSTGANITYLWFVTGGGVIVSGGTTLNPTVSGCGTYTLQVRNTTNGCTNTASVTPTCNIALPNLTATGNTITCTAPNVTISASSTTPGVTFVWSGPGGFTSTQASPTVSTAGNYTVTATNPANGCTRAATVTVNNGVLPPGASAVGGTLTCAVTSLTLQGSSPTGGVTYAWSGPNNFSSNQQNPAASTPGTYTVVVTNPANGCTSSATATVAQDMVPPSASAVGGTLTCTTLSVTLSGGSPNSGVTFAWSGPGGFTSNQQNPTVSVAGTYTLIVTQSANGCTASATATVAANTQPPGAAAVGGVLTCANLSVTLGGSSPTSNVTYTWSGPGGFTSNLQNPQVSVAGTYTLSVLNPANGCTSTATAAVMTNTTPPGAAASGGTLTCATPSIVLSGGSPTPGVTYAWSGPGGFTSNLQNPQVSVAGTYALSVLNPANGCTSTATAAVAANTAPPGASASGGTLTCATPTITLSGGSPTAGVTYAWSGPGGFVSNLQNPQVSVAGTYTLSVLNPANGCASTATAAVAANTTPPGASASGGTLTCATTAITLGGASSTSGVTYAWSGPNGFVSTLQNPVVSVAGTYTLTVLNPANGCTSAATAVVNTNTTPPTVSIATPDSLHCNATTVAINASNSSQGPGFVFLWTTSNGNIQAGSNTAIPLVNAPGVYNLLITNTNNGCIATGSATVAQIPPLVAAAAATHVACNGGNNGSAMATYNGGSGTIAYAWNNGGVTAALSNLAAGTYTVTLTDAKGCTAVASTAVSQPTALVPNVTATQQMLTGVNDGTATAAPTGGTPGYTYSWNTGQTTATITGLAPGSYTVTVRDVNNCTAVQTANVNAVNCNLSASISSTNVSCHGAANGAATANVSGANGAAVFLWSNGATTAAINNLSPGTYTVTATDATLCSQVQNVAIAEPTVLATNAMATGQTVVGQNNGTASAAPTGGTPPYTYLWSNNQTTASITGLAPGPYTLSLTDNNGCTAVQTVSVAPLVCALGATVGTEAVSCFGGANGAATVAVTGSNGAVGYLWNTGATNLAITGLPAGMYTVTATDASACTVVATGTVSQPPLLQATATVLAHVACPLDATGQVAINAIGGTAPYSIALPAGTPTGFPVGTYAVTVTDALGCTATTGFTILSTDTQAPNITCPISVTACVNTTVFYSSPTVSDNCSPGPQIALLSGQPSGSMFNIGVTTQIFRATDGSGNSATCSFLVTVNPLPAISYTATPDTNNIGQGAIQVTVGLGVPPYTYLWLKDGQFYSNQEDLNNLGAGVYQLEVTDANGCKTALAPIDLLNIVGSEEPDWLAALQLFPNPASAVLHLETGGLEIAAVQIVTPQGRLVQVVSPMNGFKDIPVEILSPGMYYLLLRTKEGWQGLLKWVKAQ